MQTNLVCEGGIGTTTVNIALDNVTSYSLTGNAWIFSSSDNSCIVKATFNGEPAQPRSPPQINSSKISINNSDQQAEVTINGKFLEPCMRRLVLEIHEKDKVDVKVTQEFGYESSSASANWINSVQLIILIPSSLLKDLNTKSIWEVSAYEYGYRELASWTSTQPTEIGIRRTILVVIIVVPIVVIIAIIIFFIIAVICLNNRANKQSDLHHKKNEDTEMNIQIVSLNVKEMKATGKIKHKQQEDPQICKHDIIYEVDKPTQVIDEDYIAELVGIDQSYTQQQYQQRQEVIDLSNSQIRENIDIRKHPVETVDAYQTTEDQQILKDELNKKIQTQIQKKKDSRKPSKKISNENKRNKQHSSNSSQSTSFINSSNLDSQTSSSSSSLIETRDVNEPKEMIEHQQLNKQKQQQQLKNKNKQLDQQHHFINQIQKDEFNQQNSDNIKNVELKQEIQENKINIDPTLIIYDAPEEGEEDNSTTLSQISTTSFEYRMKQLESASSSSTSPFFSKFHLQSKLKSISSLFNDSNSQYSASSSSVKLERNSKVKIKKKYDKDKEDKQYSLKNNRKNSQN